MFTPLVGHIEALILMLQLSSNYYVQCNKISPLWGLCTAQSGAVYMTNGSITSLDIAIYH